MNKLISVERFNKNIQYGRADYFDFERYELLEGYSTPAKTHYMIIRARVEGFPMHELTADDVDIIEIDMKTMYPLLVRYLRLNKNGDQEQSKKTLRSDIDELFEEVNN